MGGYQLSEIARLDLEQLYEHGVINSVSPPPMLIMTASWSV